MIGPDFLIFVLVFVSRDSELDQNLSGDFQKKISSDLNEIWYVGRGRSMSDARRYAVWPEPRSRSLNGSRPSVPHGSDVVLEARPWPQGASRPNFMALALA